MAKEIRYTEDDITNYGKLRVSGKSKEETEEILNKSNDIERAIRKIAKF